MNKIKMLTLATSFCLAFISFSYAQNIQGRVTDAAGRAIEGASIMVKGSTSGTTSSATGEFSINAKPADILIVSAMGYTVQELRIVDNAILTIVMQIQTTDLDPIVLLGSRSGEE